jgi:hypothetical protein
MHRRGRAGRCWCRARNDEPLPPASGRWAPVRGAAGDLVGEQLGPERAISFETLVSRRCASSRTSSRNVASMVNDVVVIGFAGFRSVLAITRPMMPATIASRESRFHAPAA